MMNRALKRQYLSLLITLGCTSYIFYKKMYPALYTPSDNLDNMKWLLETFSTKNYEENSKIFKDESIKN